MINCVNEFSGVLGTVNPRSIGHPPKKNRQWTFVCPRGQSEPIFQGEDGGV